MDLDDGVGAVKRDALKLLSFFRFLKMSDILPLPTIRVYVKYLKSP
jgi:hypothetical protein